MKHTVSIPTRFSSRARVLTGCVVLALSSAALGQADLQSTDRPATANMHDTDDHQTFEGKLVSLFHALNGHESSSTDPLKLNRQPGSHTQPGSAPQPGQPGYSTQPGSASQPGSATQPGSASQRGSATQPGSSAQPGGVTQPGQPGSATQPGSANRSQGQGLPSQSDTTSAQPGLDSSPSSMGAMPVGQPLALITDSGMSSSPTERSRSTGEGRPSTPPVGSTSGSTSERSATTGSASASGTTRDGELYILVFDPSDPASRSAYLMAQALVRSEARGSIGVIGTQGTRDSLGTPGTTGTTGDRDAASRTDSRATPGTSGATGGIASGTDREQDSLADATRSTSRLASGTGEKVKITGRVIERDGVQAIAVQKVERQYEGSTASVSTTGGN